MIDSVAKNKIKLSFALSLVLGFFLFAFSIAIAGPTSTNYELKEYAFGTGGTDQNGSSSANYKLFGIIGEQDTGMQGSANYRIGNGLNFTLQAHVPPAPTFTNPGGTSYNRLHIIINPGPNPSDTKFAIAISNDNFASNVQYLQDDATLGSSVGVEDWQTYTEWGSGTGITIGGLTPGTTYTAKVMAQQGNFTQTGFGPTAQASTVFSSLTFDIDIALTDTETAPPYAINLGALSTSAVTVSSNKVWVDIDTNATGGGMVYIKDANNGLHSLTNDYRINAVTNDLISLSEGYGMRGSYVGQTSGGPLTIQAPFNGSGNAVGSPTTTYQVLFDSSNQPITDGRGAFEIQAKASMLTKAGDDYTDIITLLVTAGF